MGALLYLCRDELFLLCDTSPCQKGPEAPSYLQQKHALDSRFPSCWPQPRAAWHQPPLPNDLRLLLPTPVLFTRDLLSLSRITEQSVVLPICSKNVHKRENVPTASALRNVLPMSLFYLRLYVKTGKMRKINRSCRSLKERKGTGAGSVEGVRLSNCAEHCAAER